MSKIIRCEITDEPSGLRYPQDPCTREACSSWRKEHGVSLVYAVMMRSENGPQRLLSICADGETAREQAMKGTWVNLIPEASRGLFWATVHEMELLSGDLAVPPPRVKITANVVNNTPYPLHVDVKAGQRNRVFHVEISKTDLPK